MSLRRALLSTALAACFAFQPLPAFADISVRMPAERSIVDGIKDALSDGSLSGDDLMGEAFTQFWIAMGGEIARVHICQEANRRTRDARNGSGGPISFNINMTVTDGSEEVSYPQRMHAKPEGDKIIVHIVKPDGSFGERIECGRAWGNMPEGEPPGDEAPEDETPDDINRFAFHTEHGRIITYLPSDIRAGDAITGTVYIEPNGADDAGRRENAARLSGYVVDVGGTQTRVADGVIRFTVGAAPGLIAVVLSNGQRVLDTGEVLIEPSVTAAVERAIPPVAQAGQPVGIPGSFDGNVSNTQVSVGDSAAEVVAESPRQVLVMCPPTPTGPLTVNVNDGGQTFAGPTNVIGITLSAPRTTLARGERTQVTMRVAGLQGLRQPIGVALWASPSVNLQGGNTQTVVIDPSDANAAGEVERQYRLRVVNPGPFDITATLSGP